MEGDTAQKKCIPGEGTPHIFSEQGANRGRGGTPHILSEQGANRGGDTAHQNRLPVVIGSVAPSCMLELARFSD